MIADHKMTDQEHIQNIEALREDEKFNQKLQRMVEALENTRVKNTKNREVLKILEKAGEDIEKALKIR